MKLETTYSRHLSDATFPGARKSLAESIALEPRLLALGEAAGSAPWAPGKWARKQVLGHLVDSAGNNLQRFVRGQVPAHLTAGALRLPGYQQDDWVRVQAYERRAWEDVVHLWAALNRHILHVLDNVDRASLSTTCHIGDGAPTTLEHIAVDYAGHVKHHLIQVLGN